MSDDCLAGGQTAISDCGHVGCSIGRQVLQSADPRPNAQSLRIKPLLRHPLRHSLRLLQLGLFRAEHLLPERRRRFAASDLRAGAGFAVFFAVEPGVTAATVLCHADFVPAATLFAPFFTDCIGDVFGVTGALSTHLFLLASGFGSGRRFARQRFRHLGMCSDGQLTFFLGVLSIQWLSSDGVVGICASCATGPAPAAGVVACGSNSSRRRQRCLSRGSEVAQP